jgi:murein DD-endopeptidase MepM/ murein hydrolase activator NlpD
MMDFESSYPVKTVSRAAARKRSGKMRIMWFVVGTSFGIGCASALTSLFDAPAVQTAAVAPAAIAPSAPVPAVEEASKEVALVMPDGKPVEAEPEPQEIAKAEDAAYPKAVDLKVENGDTLISLLTDTGASYIEAQSVVDSIGKVYDPKKLDIGQKIAVQLHKNPDSPSTPLIASVILPTSLTSSLQVTRTADDGFSVKKIEAATQHKIARSGGVINSSLYETAAAGGVSPALISELITAYSYDVDFQRDIKQGDAIDVLYERVETEDGTVIGQGNMIYAQLNLGDRNLRIYRYVDGNGGIDYYNERGESVRKALLRTPVNGARISSGFGMRNHPILGFTKMHRGVDFAAPTGTPIYAAGDGTVEMVGRKGGYGNYLRIRHNGKYASAYAHISRFASNLKPGQKVKQGQIVAYVGDTGMATGAHLHYEILANNEQVNPANVKFKNGNVLAGKELAAFRKNVARIESNLASIPNGSILALAEAQKRGLIN